MEFEPKFGGGATTITYAAVPPDEEDEEDEEREPPGRKERVGVSKHGRASTAGHKSKKKTWFRRISTWRLIVFVGLSVACVAVILNVAVLAWARTAHSDDILFQGDCGSAKSIVTGASLAINVLSTLLLGASNAAMQCLCAPTREEVDAAHARGSWLDIGVSGVVNFKRIARWRKCAWVAILASSLPLHLLFNSVIHVTSQTNVYFALMVTDEFITGAPAFQGSTDGFELTRDGPPAAKLRKRAAQDMYGIAESLQNNVTGLKRLENADCIREYGQYQVTNYLNVLLVTNTSAPGKGSVFASHLYYYPTPGQQSDDVLDFSWICNGQKPCDISAQIAHASDWTFTLDNQQYPVSHCLAQPIHPQCSVQIIPPILVVVIICNILKVICFSALMFKPRFRPLTILGDAIASFMTTPDPDAITQGPVSAEGIRKKYLADPYRFSKHRSARISAQGRSRHLTSQWHAGRRRWASAVGPKRWVVTVSGFLVLWCIGLVFLLEERGKGASTSFAAFWDQGFGTPNPSATLPLAHQLSLVGAVVVANLPQLALSFIYLYYNDVVTCMLVSLEFLRYSATHKGLRVSDPRGAHQRGAYTLSLPLKVSVPLLVGAGVLHWAMAQSLFLARVRVVGPSGAVDAARSFTTLGWSSLALLILLLVWGLMLVAVVASGARTFRRTAPPVGSNSRAILCASGFVGDGDDGAQEALRPVRYGVIGTTLKGCKRVGFASGAVEALSDGEVYA